MCLFVVTGYGAYIASPANAQSSSSAKPTSTLQRDAPDRMGERIGFATLYLTSKQSDRDAGNKEPYAPTPTVLAFIRRFDEQRSRRDLPGATSTAEKTPDPAWRDAMLVTITYERYLGKQDYVGAKQTARRVCYIPLRLNVFLQLARSQKLLGKKTDARTTLSEAHALLPLLIPPLQKERALVSLINTDLDVGDTSRAERLIRQLSSASSKAICLPKLVSTYFAAKNVDKARRTSHVAHAALMAVNEKKDYDIYALPLVKIQCLTGEFLPAYTLAKRMHQGYNLSDSLAMVALHVANAGGKKQAIEITEEALLICPKIQDSYSQDRSRENIVYALVAVGDITRAKSLAEQIFQPDMRRRAFEAITKIGKPSRQKASRLPDITTLV